MAGAGPMQWFMWRRTSELSWLILPLVGWHGASCAPIDAALEPACKDRLAGDLVITEIMADPEGDDAVGEYIELYNATAGNIQLAGLTLLNASSGGAGETSAAVASALVPAGAYVVLHAGQREHAAAHLAASYGSQLGALRNASGRVGLACGGKLIDSVTYADVNAGRARELDGALVPDSAANDDASRWCEASTPMVETATAAPSFGSPGKANSPCIDAAVTRCLDAHSGTLRATSGVEEGDLIVSELMADPAAVSNAAGEWFELYAHRDVDLNGLTLRSGSSKTSLSAPSCLQLRAGTYALLARSDQPNTNGGLGGVTAEVNLALANGASFLSIESGSSMVDEVSWTSTRKGVALQLSSEALLASPTERQSSFCWATQSTDSGDLGSPGAPNERCSSATHAGEQCIQLGRDEPSQRVKPLPGDLILTELMPHSKQVPDADGEWFEVFARRTVDLNGLELANEGSGTTTLAAAECLRAEAGSYLVFARKPDPFVNGGLPPVIATFGMTLANSGARAVVLRSEGVVIDRAAYSAAPAGVSLQLSAVALEQGGVPVAASWCATPVTHSYGLGDRGSPGAENVVCGGGGGEGGSTNLSAGGASSAWPGAAGAGGADGSAGADGSSGAEGGGASGSSAQSEGFCVDPLSGVQRPPVAPAVGDLHITEIMAAPSVNNGAEGEWFEVLATAAVDLNGLIVRNERGSNTALQAPSCLAVAAGDWLLFARSDDPEVNGGLPPAKVLFGLALADTATSSYPERTLALWMDETEIARAAWSQSTRGVARQLSSDGLATDPELSVWCAASNAAVFGAADRGTPGRENEHCP
ncbi:MAG TPA: lamin tail domain-containing protein [Polyangiaceae bacterium]|nr:lamin tail domain-containing protein [Polyangiaceae bacterium]